ncbi:sulfuric ester hydrolase [Aureococcus anophagefferens]|nr:sulfuric ester hydrolase [Aureococcus anophagefferens]
MGRPRPRVWPALLAAVGLAFAAVSWRTRTDAPTAALNEQPPLEATGETKQDLAKLAAAAETRPHVVFVMLDDVGFNDVGYASSDLGETTPFLDGLMADGVRVDRLWAAGLHAVARGHAHGQAAHPPRAPALAGRAVRALGPADARGDDGPVPQGARLLDAHGRQVAPGPLQQRVDALNRGFDSFYGFYSGGVDYLTHVSQEACLNRTDFDDDDFRRTDHATRSPDDDALDEEGRSAHVYVKDPSTGYVWRCYRDLWDNERPVTDAHGQHQTSLMNERAIAVLERHAVEKKSEPIFAYNFAALMMNADESLANLTNRGLKATGLYDTAVIVIASDNGGQVSAMGGGSNYPLRGEKKYLFEGGVRAHAVIHSPCSRGRRTSTSTTSVSGRLTALYNVTADPGERNDLKSHYPAQMKRMLKKIQNGYLPTMLVSNYRGEDDGCYEAWDDGNFVKPWGAAFGDDGTYAVDDDADIATTLADLDALIDARR